VEIVVKKRQTSKLQAAKPTVFVIMPFKSEFDVFYGAIRRACNIAKVDCVRVDEKIHFSNILSVTYESINTADAIVADMTDKSPNVYFEAGFAMAHEKPTIFLIQNDTDIPFNLKQYPHIVYEGNPTKLRTELAKRLTKLLSNPDKGQIRHPINIYNIIDESHTPMFFVGMDGIVQYCNEEIASLLGLSVKTTVGKTVDYLFETYLSPYIPPGDEPGHLDFVIEHQKQLLAKIRQENLPYMDEFLYLQNPTLDSKNAFSGFQMIFIHADRLSVGGKDLGWFVVYHTKRVDPLTAKTLKLC
jgi:PAS fold